MANFEWYRSFIAIYKCGSVLEAAKLRNMPQPEISQQLASLEAEVGQALFIRTTRKMVATDRSKSLFFELAPLIESLEETTMALKITSPPGLGAVRLGSTHEFYGNCIIPRLSKLNMHTISYFESEHQLVESLREDKLDIITTLKKIDFPEIEYLRLKDEEFVIVAPKNFEIIDTTNLVIIEEWLTSQPWISYGFELPIIRKIWRAHFLKHPLIKPLHVIPSLNIILKAVENEMGLSALPQYLLEKSLKADKSKIIFANLSVKSESFIAYKTKNKQSLEKILSVLVEDNN